MSTRKKPLPGRKTAYHYHVDNVRKDPEFQAELQSLVSRLEKTVAYAREYLTYEELMEYGHKDEAMLVKDFLDAWRISGHSLRWQILAPEEIRIDHDFIFCTVEEDRGDGLIRLVFSEHANNTEFKWLWRMVEATQANRGVKPATGYNRFSSEKAELAYVIWKKKRAGERVKWREIEEEYDKIDPSHKAVNSNSLNRIYDNHYKADFTPMTYSLKEVGDSDA